jgi:hypothetical protein
MAVESIGALVPTKIPGYADAADIQAALRAYHYGSYTFDTNETDPAELINPSIAYTINDIQEQLGNLDLSSAILKTDLAAKGDILTASANDTLSVLSVGANGYILTANSATASGLEWVIPAVTLSNSVTLTNKTLTSPTIDGLGVIFEGSSADAHETTLTAVDPTQDNTITLPNSTGTVALFSDVEEVYLMTIMGAAL